MQKAIQTISIVGAGNVATQLAKHLKSVGIEIVSCSSKNGKNASDLANQLNTTVVASLTDLPVVDLVLVCVNDDAISTVLHEIPAHLNVAYTSGSVELTALPQRERLGVFYPLQTFTKGIELDLTHVPFLIESTNPSWGDELQVLAKKISSQVHWATSEDRKRLHVGAVFVNNFTNHLAHLADQFLKAKQLNFELLVPLLQETSKKLQFISPNDAQTGPARRGDLLILEQHKQLLDGNALEIYEMLSKSILDTYKKLEE